MPIPSVQQVVADPDFIGLPATEKMKVLQRVDPDFAGLPPGQQLIVVTKMSDPSFGKSQVQAGASVGQPPNAGGKAQMAPPPPFMPRSFGELNQQIGGGFDKMFDAFGNALQSVPQLPQALINAMQNARSSQGPTGLASVPGKVGNAIGTAYSNVARAINPVGNNLGETLVNLGGYAAGAKELGGIGKGSPVPVDIPALAEKITDTVNPAPKKMTSFQQNLTQQLPNVLEQVKANGVPVDTLKKPAALADILNNAAEVKKQTYYQKMLGPVKNVEIPTNYIFGYDGPTTSSNTATLGQLDSRLAQINATLSPKYAKGGMAGQAAVTAQQSAALNAEAANIRQRLYQEIGQRVGVDPKIVADTKNSMGSLRGLAEQVQLSADTDRFKSNEARRQLPRKIAKVIGLGALGGAAGTATYQIGKELLK